MKDFNVFLETLEETILLYGLTEFSVISKVSSTTLTRCFKYNECVPRLSTVDKLINSLSWKVSIQLGTRNYTDISLEKIFKNFFTTTNISHLTSDELYSIKLFISNQVHLSLYKLFELVEKCKGVIKIVK